MAKEIKTEHNFYNMRNAFVQDSKLFQDEEFKVGNCGDIHFDKDRTAWFRPLEISKNAVFDSGNFENVQCQKGNISSESFSVVIKILAQHENLRKHVVADDQTFAQNYAGIFLFRFWSFDKVVPIIVDDMLPYDFETHEPFLSSLVDSQDFWCSLLEKAYAKFLGGYGYLQKITLADTMADILGCSVNLYSLKTLGRSGVAILRTISQHNGFTIAKIWKPKQAHALLFGQTINDTLFVVKITCSDLNENRKSDWFVTIEYSKTKCNRDCSKIDNSDMFQGLAKCNNLTDEETIEYFPEDPLNIRKISFKHFIEIFDELYVGFLRFPNLCYDTASALYQKSWETYAILGKWNHTRKEEVKMYNEPMLRIDVPDSSGCGGLSTVVASLMQSCCIKEPKCKPSEIGLTVLGLRNEEKLNRKMLSPLLALTDPVLKTAMYSERQICFHLRLEPGQYLIFPETRVDVSNLCQRPKRFLTTLFSEKQLTFINSFQKYGKEYLSELEAKVVTLKHVLIGHPIKVSVKFSNLPQLTRYTITVQLSLNTAASKTCGEKMIKSRIERIEICQGLLNKTLSLTAYYHEYAKYPLQSEAFVARCSAFVHETSTEIKSHEFIFTIYPKIQLTIDKKIYGDQYCLMTARLLNSIPLSVNRGSFTVLCSSKSSTPSSSTSTFLDIPPYSTAWAIWLLKITNPGCHSIKVLFSSSQFHRSVSADVAVMDEFTSAELCQPKVPLRLGEHPPILKIMDNMQETKRTCCVLHKTVTCRVNSLIVGPHLTDFQGKNEIEINDYTVEDTEKNMIYCRFAKESTPEKEIYSDELTDEILTN